MGGHFGSYHKFIRLIGFGCSTTRTRGVGRSRWIGLPNHITSITSTVIGTWFSACYSVCVCMCVSTFYWEDFVGDGATGIGYRQQRQRQHRNTLSITYWVSHRMNRICRSPRSGLCFHAWSSTPLRTPSLEPRYVVHTNATPQPGRQSSASCISISKS